ncbi:MAG: heterodisulfide reductase-related iron-sulfur binding cluster [Thermus sp.]|uniref:(Fe-S)-binding protein n=1 Tax=Thermus sp. TaxID=275 RepID=UPI0025D5F08B|nr:heterodisulfide reductase-related iron-sulfur binding cluster [Thermus sp.]MCS7218146.1 heterodisulfide reductase-related iron-sulfur binding cluster [Thermus sp.]MCX7850625.1 heterodisulfide reductase-related iron-sulfur binding cluster [Thermus sp.]MDW8017557.1 heterodisulfide reductase-related iron-sulfur binding cluster [Thermus sp.]
MQHRIPVETLGPEGEVMAHAIEACVHCGFCLPTCPTYLVLQEEMDSPRGRIFLMKEVLEGNLGLEEALPYLDRCLACQACVTACPSGVPYGELIAAFRLHTEGKRHRYPLERAYRLALLRTLPYPGRFRPLAELGARLKPLLQPLPLPKPLKAPLELLPPRLEREEGYAEVYPAKGERKARVGLLLGCAQRVLRPSINRATIKVLQENGLEVLAVREQVCCGALNLHAGDKEGARALARQNLRAFREVDFVVTNAAGCGSGMKEYPLLFLGEAEEEEARRLAAKVKDLTAILAEVGFTPPPPPKKPLRVAYHDACHLAHAQGVREAPRRLLKAAGVEVLEPREWEICCGSAGTYNLFQPGIAEALGRRKAENLMATQPHLVVTGNIGCLTQIQAYLDPRIPILHTAELLALLYEGQAENLPA